MVIIMDMSSGEKVLEALPQSGEDRASLGVEKACPGGRDAMLQVMPRLAEHVFEKRSRGDERMA